MKKLISSLFSKSNLPHIFALILFLFFQSVSFIQYFQEKIGSIRYPQYSGMAKQITDYRKDFNEEIYWIDNAFVGMPTFQLEQNILQIF